MKIDILADGGSPSGTIWKDIYGEALDGRVGLGGAELALHTLCEYWTKAKYEITLYNDPRFMFQSPYEQRMVIEFNPKEKRDILIIFRNPTIKFSGAIGKRVWFSTDQYTEGDFSSFGTLMDKIVCISEFHSNYFRDIYHLDKCISIDLPVRIEDYKQDYDKQDYLFIYCSVPDRGLQVLQKVWKKIRLALPTAELIITSDYNLWDNGGARNEQHKLKWIHEDGVSFVGAVNRRDMVKYQLQSICQPYPCTYDELFCISSAECQVAGAYPITSKKGALETTNMGVHLDGNPLDQDFQDKFVTEVIEFSRNRTQDWTKELQKRAIARFLPETILKQWDEKVFNG